MKRLTYSNVMATIAVFVALGGSSYAAVTLKKNSVKGKHIAPNAVTSPKVRDGSLLRSDFAAGQVPTGPEGPQGPEGPRGPAGERGERGQAGPLIQPEAFRNVGEPGQPTFNNGGQGECLWKNYDASAHNGAGFFKDPWGVVHLKGLVDADDNGPPVGHDGQCSFDQPSDDLEIYRLPQGYRPARREVFVTIADNKLSRVDVHPDGSVSLEPNMADAFAAEEFLSLDGITFRAQ